MGTEVALSELLEVLIDHRGRTPRKLGSNFVSKGVQVISAQNIVTGRLDLGATSRFVTSEVADRWMPRPLRPGDVLLSSEAPMGRVARVPHEAPRLCVGQRLFALRPKASVADSRYFAAALRSSWVQAQLAGRLSGTTAQGIRQSELRQVWVRLPCLAEQRAIADVLGALDDKIESNRRTANAARALLMQAPPSTGELSPLDQAAGFHNGGALTKHATGSGRPILRIRELRAGVTADTPRTDAPVRETHEVAAGDLLFSWSGTLLTTRWSGEPAVLNQHVFRVDSRPGLSRWFVEAWIERHLNTFRAIAADKATTMGHIQRHHLTEALVALPPHDEIDALMRAYDPLDRLRMSLLAEAERLAAIRDALLPLLVCGRLRVAPTSDSDDPIETVLDLL
jgi:type I restriction enzyme S subunit